MITTGFPSGPSPRRSVEEMRRQAESADVLNDPRIQKILKLYARYPRSELLFLFDGIIRKGIERKVMLGLPLTRSPVGAEVSGSLVNFATTEPHRAEFGLGPAELYGGLLIAGQQQKGKSSLLLIILAAIAGLMSAFCVDPKDKLRKLKSIFPNVLVVPIREWRCNLFRPPPRMQLSAWLDVLSEIFGESYGLLDLSQALFINSFNAVHMAFQATGNQSLPTFFDMAEYLRARKGGWGPNQQASDRLVGRFDALDSSLPFFTRTASGMTLDPFINAKSIVVFETGGLRIQNQRLFGKWLTMYLYYHRVYNPNPNEKDGVLLVIDEATRVLSSEYGEKGQSGSLVEVQTRAMEAKLGCIFACHQTSGTLNDTVKANTATKLILGSLGSGKDLVDMGTMCMGLQPKGWFEQIRQLKAQEAIARDSRFPEPFKIRIKNINQFPRMRGMRPVTDEEVQQDLPGLLAFQQITSVRQPVVIQSKSLSIPSIGQDDRKLISIIAALPLEKLITYYDKAGWLESKGSKVIKDLVRDDLLRTEIFSRKNGGPIKLSFLTERGYAALGMEDEGTGGKGGGGVLHRQWAQRLARYFKGEGWQCEIEAEFRHRRVDVLARRNNQVASLQIIIFSELKHNIMVLEEDLKFFDKIFVYCRTNDQLTELMAGVGAKNNPKISGELLSIFIN